MTYKPSHLHDTDYFSGYRESMKNFLDSPDRLELDRLMYEVFGKTDSGKKLLEIFKDRFIYAPTPGQISASYDHSCIYHEGYRSAFRYIIAMVNSYKDRKEHEAKMASEDK